MARLWLMKEEPTHYSFQDLQRDGKTAWEGVKNPLARKHLREMKKGDRILYYHTGKEKAVVGIARAASDPYPAPQSGDPGGVAVDIQALKLLPSPVELGAIKGRPSFKDFPLVRISRLSVMPVSEAEWAEIEAMARAKPIPRTGGRAAR